MPSIARTHAEWLNLIDISGPFLTIEILSREFGQGLDTQDTSLRTELQAAYEEWRDDQQSPHPDRAIHNRWIGYVIDTVLGHIDAVIATGQAIPADLKLVSREFGEVRPQFVIHEPNEPAKARLLVLAYPYYQSLDRQVHGNASAASPATQMMELLHATNVRLGLVTNGEQWMLVHAKPGETTSFITWYADLWVKEKITQQAFVSLLGITRFFGMTEDKTLEALMEESVNAQQEVTDQLGYQVREAVEILVQAIDRIDKARNRELLVDVDEKRLYEAALTVMMRLVFLMSAEERELLLLGDPIYDQHYAVTTLRAQLREVADLYGEEILERRFDAWSRLLAVFRAVHGGIQHENLRLPAYGGSLFDPDRFPFLEGRAPGTHWRSSNAVPLTIDNRTTLHLLEALQILQVKIPGGGMAEARRLSFRALSVTQIGHVYEGLLDHEARRAEDYVLGFTGTKNLEPEIPLDKLESFDNFAELVDFLNEQTGRDKNSATVKRALESDSEKERARLLRIVCGTDDELYNRVLPFLNLLRNDDRGRPYLVFPGGIYVTVGATRRATGTHYTPESLTIPIVKHTLEPLVYHGPAEGWNEADWQLKTPAELLELKICDMAMGSGAFLVAVVEYLSDRLLEAWDVVMKANPDLPAITPEGTPSHGRPEETLIPRDNEVERKIIAKRLVADRCIYGVDKNPLAVEMGKLSLWLVTLSKGRAFNFLDHALKCGDSLVGVNLEQLRYWNLHPEGQEEMFVGTLLQPIIDFAIEKRRQLESFTVKDIRDQQAKADLYAEAEAAIVYLKTAADHLIAETMGVSEGSVLADVVATFNKLADADDLIAALRDHPLNPADGLDLLPFHWELEFPEVFQRGGFDAFVGNPPFMRGKNISTNFGDRYLAILKLIWTHALGLSDYCAYFFLTGFVKLNSQGKFGLIATNSISQGNTRETGLDYITANNGVIFRAITDQQWSGTAAVVVNVVHISRREFTGTKELNGISVEHISSLLNDQLDIGEPEKLASNNLLSHMGSIVLGTGFVIDAQTAQRLIEVDQRNQQIVYPYLNGRDLYQDPEMKPSRWIINFGDMRLEQAETYPEPMKIVREDVKPQRDKVKRKVYRQNWWQFAEKQKTLYELIQNLNRVLIKTQVSSTWAFSFVETGIVFDQRLVIFARDDNAFFSLLQSEIHWVWTSKYSASLKNDMSYTPSSSFKTFPFPKKLSSLEDIGERYHETRREIMLNRQEGLTDTYNRFHNPYEPSDDIQRLRDLHVEMDVIVAAAYGWDDLDPGHDFHETSQGTRFTISEAARREILTRLLKLNHERYAQECHEGLHTPKESAAFFAEHPEYQRKVTDWDKVRKRKKVEDRSEQLDMFEDDNPQKRLL